MPTLPDPSPGEVGAPLERSGRRRRKRQKKRSRGRSQTQTRRGRLWLLIVFCALRVGDALYFFGIHDPGDKRRLLAAIAANLIWTTALLAGMWYRRNWCRCVLITFLGLAVVGALVAIPSVLPMLTSFNLLKVLCAETAINGAVAWLLIWSPDIKRLTNRSFD